MTIKVQAIQTGTVQIKANQIRRAGRGAGPLNIIFGKDWSDWLPIYAWVIEHPQGLFVVDTGETARTGEAGYLPRFHPYYRFAVRFHVSPQDEIGPQLIKQGWHPDDVTAVIMTHLHTDHAGGLPHFPHNRILVHATELEAALGFAGRLNGYLPHRWPNWFVPEPIAFTPEALGPFAESFPLTDDGRIMIVPTPGHSPGHVSVIVQDGAISYFLAGDTSYRQNLMEEGIIDGVSSRAAAITLHKIKEFVQERPVVYLPSHDPQAQGRLQKQEVAGNKFPAR